MFLNVIYIRRYLFNYLFIYFRFKKLLLNVMNANTFWHFLAFIPKIYDCLIIFIHPVSYLWLHIYWRKKDMGVLLYDWIWHDHKTSLIILFY